MIYLILFVVVIAVSFFLALRSMKSFQEVPLKSHQHTLYLVRNPQAFSLDTLTKLYSYSLSSKIIISLEVLLKGPQTALTLYLPSSISQSFPELSLIEIEDYLGEVNSSYAWVIQPKNNHKKILSVSPDFLKLTELEENQKFFWQIVLTSQKKSEPQFQSTIRAMVEEGDPIKRVELAKKIDKEIENGTGLNKNPKQEATSTVFESFKQRTLTPKESSPFILTPQEVYGLLGKVTH